jgi:hypothetical protein
VSQEPADPRPANRPTAAPQLPDDAAGPAQPEDAQSFEEVVSGAPIHERDRIPGFVLRIQELAFRWLSRDSRLLIGLVILIVALVAALLLSTVRFVSVIFDWLDTFALVGLFLVNWLGNGGALVPIPGARFIGVLMIFQYAVMLPSWEVFAVSGAAMALGLLSYYIVGARAAAAHAAGDTDTAEQLAADTGMLASAGEATGHVTGPAGAQDVTAATARATEDPDDASTRRRLTRRFSESWQRAQARAQPVIEKRGISGMFVLCFGPSPLGTAAAFLGGALRFGFARYLAASFAAKYLLAGIIVATGLVFSEAARSVDLPF